MKPGLYINTIDAVDIAAKFLMVEESVQYLAVREKLILELNQHASIYITETDNIIRRISES